MDEYQDIFPARRLDKGTFIDILLKLKGDAVSANVALYWRQLGNEGSLCHISHVFKDQPTQLEYIKAIIYSFAAFLTRDDYESFKDSLGVHGHIFEFVHALLAENLGVIEYFITVAKSPRYFSPSIIQWFWQKAKPLISGNRKLYRQMLENSANAINRWTKAKKKAGTLDLDPPATLVPFGTEGVLVPQDILPVNLPDDTAGTIFSPAPPCS